MNDFREYHAAFQENLEDLMHYGVKGMRWHKRKPGKKNIFTNILESRNNEGSSDSRTNGDKNSSSGGHKSNRKPHTGKTYSREGTITNNYDGSGKIQNHNEGQSSSFSQHKGSAFAKAYSDYLEKKAIRRKRYRKKDSLK